MTRWIGLQAQTPNAPYIALWLRLKNFDPQSLTAFIRERHVVRITLMHSTLYSVTDNDCLELRPYFQHALLRSMRGAFGKNLNGLKLKHFEAAARKLLEQQPLTFNELGRPLAR